MYLTKSDFRTCLNCEAKLNYLAAEYPRNDQEDEYLRLLAEGGFVVGELAKRRFSSGREMERGANPEEDFARTREAILEGDGVLFEATLLHGRQLALADIIERRGDVLRLIEVKSKSFESQGAERSALFCTARGGIRAEWLEYLCDVAFQYAVAAACFPNLRVIPYLLLVDKSKRSEVEGLPSFFSLERGDGAPRVRVHGDGTQFASGAQLLTEIDVSAEVRQLLPEAQAKIRRLERALVHHEKIPAKLSVVCRDCQFRGDELSPSGFAECWKGMPSVEHHLFDLYFGTTIKVDGALLLDTLISEGKCSLFDVPLEDLKGKRGERQRIQIECTEKNSEWFDPRLDEFLRGLRYPLHFIDFETTRTALPFHAGMRPFEQLAFQWSCHTVTERHAAPLHAEWINTEPRFPNFTFARSLMEHLSKDGTVLTWASHEGNVLTDILNQMELYKAEDAELAQFLQLLVSSKGSQGRLVDMNKLTADFYFHPKMQGRTSIKKVFPAVWRSDAELRKLAWFAPFERVVDGEVTDPYESLAPIEMNGVEVSVREGTAAMRAYEEMIFGSAAQDAELKRGWERLLLQYCHLDTLAMVAIWEHWERLSNR